MGYKHRSVPLGLASPPAVQPRRVLDLEPVAAAAVAIGRVAAPGSRYNKLRGRTRSDYAKILKRIKTRHGEMQLEWIETRPEIRGVFRTWRGELAKKSKRQADYAWSVLSAVFTHGIDYGSIKRNPLERGGRLYSGTRIERVWDEAQIKAFVAQANDRYPELVLPLTIALWTGLHEADVLTLPWSAYDGHFIRLRQRKGDGDGRKPKRLEVPVAGPLKTLPDESRKVKKSTIICVNKGGKPWKENPKTGFDGFRSTWQKCAKKAGVHKAVAFTDLRGTAVTRLWKAGVEKRHIAIFTGHTEAEVNEILRVHYLHRDEREEGVAAIRATEALFAPKAGGEEEGEADAASADVIELTGKPRRRKAKAAKQ